MDKFEEYLSMFRYFQARYAAAKTDGQRQWAAERMEIHSQLMRDA